MHGARLRAKGNQSNSLVLGSINGITPRRQIRMSGLNDESGQAISSRRRSGAFTFQALLRNRGSVHQDFRSGASLRTGKRHPGSCVGYQRRRFPWETAVSRRIGGDTPEYGALAFIATDTSQNGRFSFLDRDLTTERMSILNTGNVGIGTINPSARLEIVGNLKITSGSILYGAVQDVPDYVFQPGYKLMPVENWEITSPLRGICPISRLPRRSRRRD